VTLLSRHTCRIANTYGFSSRAAENLKLFWGTRFFYQFVKIISVFAICFILNNASGYIYGALLSALILIITYYKRFSKQFSMRKLFVFNPHFKFLLFFGIPLIFNALSGSILSYADRFFVQGFLNKRELGIYTFTYSLGSSLFFFFGITLISFEPLAYKYAKEKKDFRRVLNSYSKVVPSAAFIFALLIIFFFKPYVTHMLNPAYLNGYFILPVLLSAHLLLPMYNIGTIEFIILSKPKFIAYTTIFSACINLFFNFLLIPSMGIAGAALSTFITYFMLIASIHFLLIQRKVLSIGTYKYGYLQTIFFCILIFLFAYNENLFVRIIFLIAASTYLLIHIFKMKNFFNYTETGIPAKNN